VLAVCGAAGRVSSTPAIMMASGLERIPSSYRLQCNSTTSRHQTSRFRPSDNHTKTPLQINFTLSYMYMETRAASCFVTSLSIDYSPPSLNISSHHSVLMPSSAQRIFASSSLGFVVPVCAAVFCLEVVPSRTESDVSGVVLLGICVRITLVKT
jgi:hypothetical protein